MKKKELSGKDLLLCFLFSPGVKSSVNEPIVGRTKITKMMFLFEKEIQQAFFSDSIEITFPQFEAYNYGPFSKELLENISFFQSIGMIIAEETTIPLSAADKIECSVFDEEDDWAEAQFDESMEEHFECSYKLSQKGEQYVKEQLWDLFSDKQKNGLQVFKAQINRISLDALLRYVYNKYPDSAKNSLIADKYLSKAEL